MPKRGNPVHVATTRRHYKGKVYETHLLRRSYREGGKVKNETLGNLSHLPAELIDLLRRALAGERFISLEQWELGPGLPHGHVIAVLGMMKRLGAGEAARQGALAAAGPGAGHDRGPAPGTGLQAGHQPALEAVDAGG